MRAMSRSTGDRSPLLQAYLSLGDALALPRRPTHFVMGVATDGGKIPEDYKPVIRQAIENGLHSSPWSDPKPGAHVARAAKSYLHSQVEAGHGCPITMTFAVVPALRVQADLASMADGKFGSTYPNGCHIAEVEIDPDTYEVKTGSDPFIGVRNVAMQLMAREMNLSETVFVLPGDSSTVWHLRWFTPTAEEA